MPMDPKKAECVGLYLYGAGWHAREDNTLSIVRGERANHFCLICPKRAECENEHEQRVRQTEPQAVEVFEVRMRQAARRGIGATMAAMYLAKQGLDPFAIVAVENFKQGHADRGTKDGALIQ